MTTYQDVVRANGGVASWAFAEAAGLDFAPWLGGGHLTGAGGFDYQQPGPFAGSFSVGIHAGAVLSMPLTGVWGLPNTIEMWIKMGAPATAPNEAVWSFGNAGANGGGCILLPTTNEWEAVQTSTGYDLGVAIPAGAWHLLQLAYTFPSNMTAYKDGIPVWQSGVGSGVPVPNTFYIGGSSTRTSNQLMNVAYPVMYMSYFDTPRAAATFLAASDPATAITFTPGGQALAGATNADLLAAIYAAVHKTW